MDDRKKNLKDNATFWDERSKIFDTQVMQIYDRAYDKTIQRALRFLEPEDVILDLGCGTGRTTIPISKKVKKVYAIDTSKDMLEKGVKKAAAENCENITFAHTDLMHAKLKPGSLDAVLVFNVLLYFKNQDEVLKKIHKLLKPGGMFISATDCLGRNLSKDAVSKFIRSKTGKMPYVAFQTPVGLMKKVEKNGFLVLEAANLHKNPPNIFLAAQKIEK